MRNFLLLVSLLGLLCTYGCDPIKKVSKDGGSNSSCTALEQVKSSFFNELSSANYQLNALRQNGDDLEMDIVSSESFSEAKLYWTGAVRKSYPPQASVKLILTKKEDDASNTRQNLKHSLCFDVSQMKTYGERIKLYIMDDEEAIDLYFKQ